MELYLHSPYIFMVWCLIKHRENLTFTHRYWFFKDGDYRVLQSLGINLSGILSKIRLQKTMAELTLKMDSAFWKHAGFVQLHISILISRNFPICSGRGNVVVHLPGAKHLQRQIFDKLTCHLKI
jgi:hypothetical protein